MILWKPWCYFVTIVKVVQNIIDSNTGAKAFLIWKNSQLLNQKFIKMSKHCGDLWKIGIVGKLKWKFISLWNNVKSNYKSSKPFFVKKQSKYQWNASEASQNFKVCYFFYKNTCLTKHISKNLTFFQMTSLSAVYII